MSPSRTKAILRALGRGRDDRTTRAVMKVFGASSLEECHATYDLVGAAERSAIDQAVEHVAKDGTAAFWLSVENDLAAQR